MNQEMEGKRIIEVGGVKLEVDLRHARVVENFKIGDNVKVLIKTYGDSFKSHPGIIVGFDNFKERPTIVVAYVEDGYSADIKMLYINRDTKDAEFCLMTRDELVIDKGSVLQGFDRQIAAKQAEIASINEKRLYFTERFGRYFEASAAIEKALGSVS